MPFDEKNWIFPIDKLHPKSAVLCLVKDGEDIMCIGCRIECNPVDLPDINSGYEDEINESPEILLNFEFPFASLESLSKRTLNLGENVEECAGELGSTYIFGAHNPVGWNTIQFREVQGETISAVADLYFDFEFEDRIGGQFRHEMHLLLEVERRWEI